MLTGLVIGALVAIGGGSDSVEPEYMDSVHFDTAVIPRPELDRDVRDTVERYEDTFNMSWSEASRWHLGDDNREYGILDVSERFSRIYGGVSLLDGEVIVWISSPAKSGGIIDLLDDYDVDAQLHLIPQELDFEQAAYHFMSNYGSPEYFAAEPNEEATGLVISVDSEEAADRGPLLYGTIIDGVPVEYHWSE